MKNILRACVTCIFTLVVAFCLCINVCAQEEVDFDALISEFEPTSLNTFSLEIGDIHTPSASVWLSAGGSAASSDTSVVTVSDSGDVTAVDEGTAYVVITSSTGMQSIYKYDIFTESEKALDASENVNINHSADRDVIDDSGSFFASHMKVMKAVFAAFFIFFILTFVSSVSSVSKINRIKQALGHLSADPCQQTADEFLKALKVNFMQRYIISHSHEYNGGISKRDCVDVYINIVDPSPEIDDDTKKQIRDRMISIGCVFTKGIN